MLYRERAFFFFLITLDWQYCELLVWPFFLVFFASFANVYPTVLLELALLCGFSKWKQMVHLVMGERWGLNLGDGFRIGVDLSR